MTVDFASEQRGLRIVHHLTYHIELMAGLVPWMVTLKDSRPNILRHACLESFLTHFRLLVEFIDGRPARATMNRKRYPKDAQPLDLGLVAWTCQPPQQFDIYLQRIDRYQAHLTNFRIDTPTPQAWPVETMTRSLITAYANLADALARNELAMFADDLRVGIEQALQILASPPEDWPRKTLGA